MTVTVKPLIPAKIAESTQTTQYTATNVTAIIDKFTATNYSAAAATISVNLVTGGDTSGNQNLITKTKTLQPADAYSIQMTQTERTYGDNNLINTAGVVRWHNWSSGGGGTTGLLGGLGRNGDPVQSQYRLSLNNNQFPWSYYGTSDIYAGIAAPTSGTYKQGDRVLNNAPAVGQPKGWVCTVAGTPGTWVSEGNL
jgi:hypothetical protein